MIARRQRLCSANSFGNGCGLVTLPEGANLMVVATRAMLERQGVSALLAHTKFCIAVAETSIDAAEQAAQFRIQPRDETAGASDSVCEISLLDQSGNGNASMPRGAYLP